ncbi:MAG: hypothetical protein AAF387_13920 [Pseudomonadota bacterium]
MAKFKQLLLADPEDLVRAFYKLRTSRNTGFIARLDEVASALGVTHSQLVCGLGFRNEIERLPDVLSVLGFETTRPLILRRDELFKTDIYNELSVDDVIDVYTKSTESDDELENLQDLVTARLNNVESSIADHADPNTIICYKMELHAIYNSEIADEAFAEKRLASKNHALADTTKIQQDELRLIVDNKIIPASNLFFSDTLSPEEKLLLIESGEINVSMIKNRMQNTEISPEERDMLEDNLR